MIVHDLGAESVARMTPVDLATAKGEPPSPIGYFDFHDCICGIGSFSGRPPWELHTANDELLHILAGESELTVLEPDGPVTRRLVAGDLVVVPKGCWHSNDAPNGVTMLFMTPKEGNRHSFRDPRQDAVDAR
jgi:mannose-6-phosphate isomerase-like protein (cupin superfamily)